MENDFLQNSILMCIYAYLCVTYIHKKFWKPLRQKKKCPVFVYITCALLMFRNRWKIKIKKKVRISNVLVAVKKYPKFGTHK